MRQSIIAGVIAAVLLAALAPGCTVVANWGKMETRDFDIAEFTGVAAEDAFAVEVRQGDSFAVTVTAGSNVFERLDIRKQGSTLHLGLKAGVLVPNARHSATVVMSRLDSFSLSGASMGRLTGFRDSRPLSLSLSGASALEIDDATAGETEVSLTGGSDLAGKLTTTTASFSLSGDSDLLLDGAGTDANVSASGSSHADLRDFAVHNAEVSLSGGSNVRVFVTGDLQVSLSGGSQLEYEGNPTLRNVDISGGSSLTEV